MWKGALPDTFSKAKKLRGNMTQAESILWSHLRQNKFLGLKFRRQHPIQNFIADFYCHQLELIIEIDGLYHQTRVQQEVDSKRSEILNFNGIQVIRFTNNEVEHQIESVLQKIEVFVKKSIPLPRPYPESHREEALILKV